MKTNDTPKPIKVGAKTVGTVQGDTLRKVIRPEHFLRTPPAICFDVAVLDQAEQAGARRVLVIDASTGTQYRATIAHIREHGFSFNRGFGDQIGLPLSTWAITRRGEIPAEQLQLWQAVQA